MRHIVVVHHGRTMADTTGAVRVLETSHPPAYYLPLADVATDRLVRSGHRRSASGRARRRTRSRRVGTVACGRLGLRATHAGFELLRDHVAFYAEGGRVQGRRREGRAATAASTAAGSRARLLADEPNERVHASVARRVHDSDGDYVGCWLLELASLPAAQIHEPASRQRQVLRYVEPICVEDWLA